jgi:hypothetical protein
VAQRSTLAAETPKGKLFNFKPYGGAKAVLSKMDPAILDKVIRTSKKDLDGVIEQLDKDPDFVSSLSTTALAGHLAALDALTVCRHACVAPAALCNASMQALATDII